MYKNTIATHDATQAELDRKLALEGAFTSQRAIYLQDKKENEVRLKNAKENLNGAIIAYNSSVKDVNDAQAKTLKTQQELIILKAQQQTDANKAAVDKEKEHDQKLAEQRKAKQEKIKQEQEKNKQDDAQFIKGLNAEAENLAADTEEYLYLYQYKYVDAVLAWHPYLKLLPNQFNANYSVVFTAGVGTVTVEIPSIALPTTGAAYSASNFNIQATVSNSSPTAVSVEIGTVTPGDVYTLPITLRAAQYSSSTWSSVNSTKLVYLAISVV
jgi:hypothetical protein